MKLDYLKAITCVALFVGLFLMAHAAVAAPTPSGTRAGLRGLRRQRALTSGTGWARVEPLIRWGGMRLTGILSAQLRASLDRQIGLSGGFLGLLPEELVFLSILCALSGAAVGLVVGPLVKLGPLSIVAVGAFGALAPFLWISGEASERAKSIGRRLPNAIDLIALGMGAGLDFPGALKQTLEKSGTPDDPLIEELSLTMQSLELGRTRRQALEEFADRVPIEPVREFVGAIVQAEQRGNPLAEVL
ncbi:MAG TPA: type II secretion system F family protein, partial [Labilithrix sp.]|nr:type II secretion system F family protein [Labilithrix sp.]